MAWELPQKDENFSFDHDITYFFGTPAASHSQKSTSEPYPNPVECSQQLHTTSVLCTCILILSSHLQQNSYGTSFFEIY
jgi:hypothetical protein